MTLKGHDVADSVSCDNCRYVNFDFLLRGSPADIGEEAWNACDEDIVLEESSF